MSASVIISNSYYVMGLKPTAILTPRQLLFLDTFSHSTIHKQFILSGGTALCGFYIPYRLSEDLDFFSQSEFDIQDVVIWMHSIKSTLLFESFDVQQSFNRNLIFLRFADETLKTEFTYYPFPSKKLHVYQGMSIDSIEDIALNKLFTIYQTPRLRDYMDLYKICLREQCSLSQLRIDAKTKFDWNIDPIQLGTQLHLVHEQSDMPRVIGSFPESDMLSFYDKWALELA